VTDFRDKLQSRLTVTAIEQTIDDIGKESEALTFIETTTEFTMQNRAVCSNISKLSLIALGDIDA
jgi:hypothetical protein